MITYTPTAGKHIDDACVEAVSLARAEQKTVSFKFNDVALEAIPEADSTSLAADYNRICSERRAAYEASPEGKQAMKDKAEHTMRTEAWRKGVDIGLEDVRKKYPYTDDMGEISGFGGGYEQGCRRMLLCGLRWLDETPGADPKFSGYKNVFGVINDTNKDAEALSECITTAEPDCTGAMHQAVIGHLLYIKANGYEKWANEMRKKD